MRTSKLESIFAVILASSSVGARGGCGPCPDQHQAFPVLPPANGDASAAPNVPPKDAGTLTRDQCVTYCDASDVLSCTYEEPGGAPTMHCVRPGYCGAGRRPSGLRRARPREGVGSWLAAMARLEAASVLAFERLENELRAHGAPKRMCARAGASARDEVRHARMMTKLAARRGTAPEPLRCASARRVRPLLAVARENAVEGCVREAYGALLATWQARAAHDAATRAVFSRIARDETRHAALSWSVATWAERRLSAGDRARVRRARADAWRALDAELAVAAEPEVIDAGLLPPAQLARQWLAALARAAV